MDETWVTPDDNPYFCSQRHNAFLEPSALCVRFAPVNKLYSRDVYCESVSCRHLTVDFLEFLTRNQNHHHMSDDVEYRSQRLLRFRQASFLHCKALKLSA